MLQVVIDHFQHYFMIIFVWLRPSSDNHTHWEWELQVLRWSSGCTSLVNPFYIDFGFQVLGPFHKSFTSIVGPNGSGKSNVIDSMLFVFGSALRRPEPPSSPRWSTAAALTPTCSSPRWPSTSRRSSTGPFVHWKRIFSFVSPERPPRNLGGHSWFLNGV